jgi:starch synthase
MKILFCASEVTPFAKTGGLADVAGSLPLALGRLGAKVLVTMPRYRGVSLKKKKLSENVTIVFIENEEYFNRSSFYGNEGGDYADNLERFAFFSDRSLLAAKELKFKPDVVHAHDWQTALVPVYLKTRYAADPFFKDAKSVLTIHNLSYQGHFPESQFEKTGLAKSFFSVDGFEYYGKVNLLKGGLLFADAVSTVSPTYAKEIQTKHFGHGLEGVIQKRRSSLRGILNGIDTDFWDPAQDEFLKENYSAKAPAAKTACQADLRARLNLKEPGERPVFSIVSRLAEQKGIDLFLKAADRFFAKPLDFVLLGDGDRYYQTAFKEVAKKHTKNARIFLGFDAAEAHAIYAGSDFFLMPSLFEPCGLGQMISLRYGTLPIVRRTGGLADTIVDVDADPKQGNGFVFEDHSEHGFLDAVDRAIRLFEDKKRFHALRKKAMGLDFSWKASAKKYMEFYKEICG